MFCCGKLTCDQAEEDYSLFEGSEILVEELLRLKYINVLTVNLRSCETLQRFLSSQKLESYTQSLRLQCFVDSKSIDVLCLTSLEHLSFLEIEDCKLLEELKIGNIGVIQHARKPHAFHSLVTVRIFSCCKLRDLTWLVFAPNPSRIIIVDCSDMEEIISVGKLGEAPKIMANIEPFTELKYLVIRNLPNLKSIYCKALPFQNLDLIDIVGCPELGKLPLDSKSAKQRKILIRGEEDWWKKLQWEDQATQNAFLPFFTEIKGHQRR